MLRNLGARLAVPLLSVILLASLALLDRAATAIDACRPTPTGIECDFDGTTTSVTVVPGGSLPPVRYLSVSGGVCWYWSRYPPGLDSWDSANDQAIILTRLVLPECRGRPTPPPTIITSVRAWEIFRAFPLDLPESHLTPSVGVTNLPTRLHLATARPFIHQEKLPDGRILEVQAWVDLVSIDWGDGTPEVTVRLGDAVGDPGPLHHTFTLKTCPPWYRSDHLDGPKCHPTLESYPIVIEFEWWGRYRVEAEWVTIGTIDRSRLHQHDVDEVLGILVSP